MGTIRPLDDIKLLPKIEVMVDCNKVKMGNDILKKYLSLKGFYMLFVFAHKSSTIASCEFYYHIFKITSVKKDENAKHNIFIITADDICGINIAGSAAEIGLNEAASIISKKLIMTKKMIDDRILYDIRIVKSLDEDCAEYYKRLEELDPSFVNVAVFTSNTNKVPMWLYHHFNDIRRIESAVSSHIIRQLTSDDFKETMRKVFTTNNDNAVIDVWMHDESDDKIYVAAYDIGKNIAIGIVEYAIDINEVLSAYKEKGCITVTDFLKYSMLGLILGKELSYRGIKIAEAIIPDKSWAPSVYDIGIFDF